ncbi:MAG: hypothetical protein HYY30_08380 [Chloroflexi bacterium]|nr:hypothetical protein [Chloroflexota bacterium]
MPGVGVSGAGDEAAIVRVAVGTGKIACTDGLADGVPAPTGMSSSDLGGGATVIGYTQMPTTVKSKTIAARMMPDCEGIRLQSVVAGRRAFGLLDCSSPGEFVIKFAALSPSAGLPLIILLPFYNVAGVEQTQRSNRYSTPRGRVCQWTGG